MIQQIIHRLLLRRHFWRYATFSEIAELYASRTMRIFALRLITVFTAIYLYQEGYSLVFLAFFWAVFSLYKIPFAWPAALIIARFGPKHATFVSNILAAASLLFLPLIGEYGLWPLAVWCVLHASSSCLYDMAYLVDFSKVKSTEHAGKEIAFMNMIDKVMAGVAPVVGGFLAFWAGPHVTILLAAVLFLLAAVPLFNTAEPVRTHQRLSLRGLPWHSLWRSLRAEVAIGADVFATNVAWVLFMAVVVFGGSGSQVYAQVGVLASIAVVSALLASYAFGKLIDHRRGRELLQISTVVNSAVHVGRAFAVTPVGAALVNVLNEVGTTGYAMAFTRGMFDTADRSGQRVAYLFLIEVAINLGAGLAAAALGVALLFLPDELGLQTFFVIVAVATLAIASPRFVLYRK